jgi:hypothetical protein
MEKHIEYYENGQKSDEYNRLGGRLHGKYERWYDNGQKMMEMFFIHGKAKGKYERWYKSGKKECEFTWFEDKFHGKYEGWDQQGKLIFSEDYVFSYRKKFLLIILRTLRKAKWIRLAKMTKTKAFNEWWYNPDNYGGIIAKKKLSLI